MLYWGGMKETEVTTSSQDKQKSQSAVFVSMALDMSWRLAIVVLVPIIGGFKLDEALEMTPLLTIVGFLMAMTGMALVCWRTLRQAAEVTVPPASSKPGSKSKLKSKSNKASAVSQALTPKREKRA